MNRFKAKKRRRFLLGFIPSMLILGLPILIAAIQLPKYATVLTVLAIAIPIIIGILIAKTAKE